MSRDLLVIGASGAGPLYCLELQKGGEAPVILLNGSGAEAIRERIAEDFGEFLLRETKAQLSVRAGG